MFFSLMAFSFLLNKKYIRSYLSLFVSIGIKFLNWIAFADLDLSHCLADKKKENQLGYAFWV